MIDVALTLDSLFADMTRAR